MTDIPQMGYGYLGAFSYEREKNNKKLLFLYMYVYRRELNGTCSLIDNDVCFIKLIVAIIYLCPFEIKYSETMKM